MCAAETTSISVAPEDVVALFKEQGRRVFQTPSCWWYNAYGQKRVYFAFPPHRLVSPSGEETSRIFKNNPGAYALRFIGPPRGLGDDSFIWVRRGPYDLESLSANTRSKVRRGLRHCRIRALDFDELVRAGETAQQDTLQRLGKEARAFRASKGMHESRAYQAWGAFVDDQLAAFLVTLRVEDWVHIQVNRSADQYLKFYPNNALVFSVTQQLLSDPQTAAVCYGWEPLTRIESLEQFKLSMGFVKEPVRQQVVPAPPLRILLNPVVRKIIEKAAAWRVSDQRLQQLAGLCRFIK